MAIKITGGEVRPALTYDKLHIINFTLRIEKVAQSPKKIIDIVAVPYGLDAEGNRIYSDKQISVSTKDFDTDILTYAITNGLNTDVTDALTEYATETAAVSAAVSAGSISIWHLMAEFEAALGKVFDIKDAADFDTVE